MTTAKDYRNDIRPNWCPGCGHYGVQAAITDAVVAKNIPPEKLAVISGIGCSSRIGGYFYAYGAHTTHGRALPYAQGVKVNHLQLRLIKPFPAKQLQPFFDAAKKVVIVEHNKTGQLANLFKINMHKKHKISSCLKYDGNPFTKSYVKNAIKEVL